jgi:hypothetical protein
MAHPYHHALSSVRKWGGVVADYQHIHDWFDASKMIVADFRHRALRHHAEGIYMAETIFGTTITNADGRVVPVRWIGETACSRGSPPHPVLCRLGQGHPARIVDGTRSQAGGIRRRGRLDAAESHPRFQAMDRCSTITSRDAIQLNSYGAQRSQTARFANSPSCPIPP